ncbi:GNAT family N-acetyltransferase [Paenibacillus sp. KQZ6P-2]|uniref:GNAT family N-acetyltransferase n=1 Tax=Paenibacillus mangrovi TaxID=2931978 RepID=A0A9X1WLK9_9BACL|nr:GNAT family protein [Paenibacillus mangrovi]MCJ8010911.1 GNAT family N-acetyltransferase [Paenibacillus mangrovi]
MERLKSMNLEDAAAIASWKYPHPYDLYSMDGSEEDISDLMNGDYVSVRSEEGEIIGFYCTGNSARVPGGYDAGIYHDESLVDFGLGMNPELTGQGRGTRFVEEGIAYVKRSYPEKGIRLVVATFNGRAMRTYEKAGFKHFGVFTSPVHHRPTEFACMIKRDI